ncbi:MAG: GNAT family N-acetyltransferase [Acidimicrobiales bacterium]|jgi:GNAT superfamily N-acetyltransferase
MTDIEFRAVEPDQVDAVWCMQQYFTELESRFARGFDMAGAHALDIDAMRSPDGQFLVAYFQNKPVACGGIRPLGAHTGEIKRMWLDTSVRGRGLGRQLLQALESSAVAYGHRVLRLDTNETLVEAIALYKSSGYVAIDRYNDDPNPTHFFEKLLT